MNKQSILLGAAALVLGGVALAPGIVNAYQGDPNVQGPNYSPERHEAMTQAFENKDYQAWKNLMQGRGRVIQLVNEANFAKFSEAHQLALEGKTDEANQIRAELGLGQRNGSGMGQGQGFGRHSR